MNDGMIYIIPQNIVTINKNIKFKKRDVERKI